MRIVVNGVGYPMPDNFTFREMSFIKRMTGLTAGELYPALDKGDTDVIAAFAVTAMRRDNPAITEDAVLDLTLEQIDLIGEEEEATDSPPAETADAPTEAAPPPVPSVTPSSDTPTASTRATSGAPA